MASLTFHIDCDPRGQGRPRFRVLAGHVHPYKAAEDVAWEKAIRQAFVDEALTDKHWPMRSEKPVGVYVRAIQPVAASMSKKRREQILNYEIIPTKKPDLDNIVKSVLDALNKIAWKDDTQVVSITAAKLHGERPGLTVRVWEVEPCTVDATRSGK